MKFGIYRIIIGCSEISLGNHLQISQHDELLETLSWQQINAILIIGKHHLSTPVLYNAMHKSVPIYFLSHFGNYQGELNAANHFTQHKDLHLKQAQYFSQKSTCLTLAQTIVQARAYSQWVVLIPFLKSNNTKALIIVHFSVLKKPRIAISILGFLSTLKQTIISTF